MKFLLLFAILSFLISSCTYIPNYKGSGIQQALSQTAIKSYDSAKNQPYTVTAKPAIFETAYFDGTEATVNDTVRLTFYTAGIGTIKLTTGKVVACDPVMSYQQEAFVTQFPKGRFPVQLAIAKLSGGRNEWAAFSRILFSGETVARWEMALKKGQSPIPVFSDSSYYYPVDGGLGQFMDESDFNRQEALSEHSETLLTNHLFAELDKHTYYSWQYANTAYQGISTVAFTSGFGDGRYTTYIGYDKNDKPCRLLTDFQVVDFFKLQ